MPGEINYLVKGYKNFKYKYFEEHKELFQKLQSNQKPKVLFIGCCDSRVDPSILFDCQPGDLFVVRNVANLVPAAEHITTHNSTIAAIEYGVTILNIKHIVVCGHSKCGGIKALFHEPKDSPIYSGSMIPSWISLAEPSVRIVKARHNEDSIDMQIDDCAMYSIINSLYNLKTFDWIRDRIEKKSLFIHGWFFDVSTGIIKKYTESGFNELDT